MTIIRKFGPIEETKKFPKLWIALTAIFLLSVVSIEIWVNNETSAYGSKFEKITNITHIVNMENQVLENEIAKNSSLLNISSSSAQLGFSVPTSIQYIR